MSVISPPECASRFAAEAPKRAAGSALGFTETAAGQSGTRSMAGWALGLIDADNDRRSSDPIPEHLRLLKDPI